MRQRVAQLHDSGAIDGDVLTYDGTAGLWTPQAPSGGSDWTLLDAKGDLLVASAADTPARLAVGADGTILTADSTQTLGVRWGSALTDPTTTKGDILARTSSALVRRPVGTDGQVLTADSAEVDGVKWATPSGGGGGGSMVPVRAQRTAGNVTVGTTEQNIDTALDLTLTGVTVGDVIEFGINALWDPGGSTSFANLGMATVVSGAIVNYCHDGGTAFDFGEPAWFSGADSGAHDYVGVGAPCFYTVQSSDLSSGTLILRLRGKGNGATRVLRGLGTDGLPIKVWARNLGQ